MYNQDKIEELQEILKQDSQDFQTRRELAMLLSENGFAKEALQHLLYLAKIFENDGNIFYNLGIVYEKLKDLDNAINSYKKAVELSPGETDFYYNLGLVYIDKKMYEEAIDCMENVLQQDKDDSNAYFSIGLCYFKEKKWEGAKYYFERTTELNDDDLYAHFYIGNILKDAGDLNGAKKKFEKVLELSPDYSWAYFNIASIYYEQGDFNSALENLQKTLELNPKDYAAYEIYAKILIKTDKPDEAADILEIAQVQGAGGGNFYYTRAQVEKLLNNKENCNKYLDLAIKNYKTLSVSIQKVQSEKIV